MTIDLFLPYPFYLVGGDYQKFVVSRYIGSWGFVGLSMFNFKVRGLLAYTPGTTSSYPGPAWSVGPEFTERYLELVEKGNLSHLGRERGRTNEWYQRRSLHNGNKLRSYNSMAPSVKHRAKVSAETERSDQI